MQQNAALVKVSPIGYCGAPRFHKRQMSRFFAVIVFAVAGAHLPLLVDEQEEVVAIELGSEIFLDDQSIIVQ